MGVNQKNNVEHHRDNTIEAPENILTAQLEQAYKNFKDSPEILQNLQEIVNRLQKINDGVKLPYARLLSELTVSNDVFALIGSRAPILAIDNSSKFTA